MNSKLLKSVMVLNDDNITTLSKKLGVSRQTLSLKIDGINEFKPSEICVIGKLYNLSVYEVYEIFFKGCKGCNECA